VATVMVLATSFMFRVPSECLPLCSRSAHSSVQAIEDGGRPALLVTLASRKNLPKGSEMIRRCICLSGRKILCPVCELRDHLGRFHKRGPGRLFDISAAAFTKVLRRLILTGRSLFPGVVAEECSSHIFRRSSANELLRRRTPLGQIMRAGQWGGGGFLHYLLQTEIDREATFECMVDGSDSEGEDLPRPKRAHRVQQPLSTARTSLPDPFATSLPAEGPLAFPSASAEESFAIVEPDFGSIFGRARRVPGSPARQPASSSSTGPSRALSATDSPVRKKQTTMDSFFK